MKTKKKPSLDIVRMRNTFTKLEEKREKKINHTTTNKKKTHVH